MGKAVSLMAPRPSTAGSRKHPSPGFRYARVSACLFLLVFNLLIYGQVFRFQFVHMDDGMYVVENPHIQRGLTRESVQWAFGADLFYDSPNADRWQPLIFLSRMLDVRLFGMNAGAHHVMNIFWHSFNVILLFILFLRMTGNYWRSFALALFFAVHPTQAEPVAWITARKDLLSFFFALLTCHAYISFAAKPSHGRMALTILGFALSLMSKSVMVVLPLLLLCLDLWPLQRIPKISLGVLIWEKRVLFLISLMAVPLAFLGVPSALGYASPWVVFSKLFPSWLFYFSKWCFPWGLGFYGADAARAAWPSILLSILVFLALASWAVREAGRRPWVSAGFFWFTLGIAPVAGLEIPGDRFLYMPACGLTWAVVWLCGEWVDRASERKAVAAAAFGCLVALLSIVTARQVSTWRSSETLFRRALEINPRNSMALNSLGVYYGTVGRYQEAAALFTRALGVSALNSDYYNNLGAIYSAQGMTTEALKTLEKSRHLNPYNPKTLNNIANIHVQLGNDQEACRYYEQALAIDPDYTHALNNWGVALSRQHEFDKAGEAFSRAVKVGPRNAEAYKNWAQVFLDQGKREEALVRLLAACDLNPYDPVVFNNTGATLSELGRYEEAFKMYRKAMQLKPDFSVAVFNAGHAALQMERRDEARRYFSEALRLNPEYEKARLGLKLLDESGPEAGKV